MKKVYLALGSNMGQREGYLNAALSALQGPDLRRVRVSSLYETEPIGLREQAWFLNMAAEFETDLFPLQLLHRTQRVELDLGRRRAVRNGPRTIDIDVLYFGSTVMQSGELTIPHPRLHERRFVLEPLAEIAPEFRDPAAGCTVRQLLAAVEGQKVRRL